MLPSELLDLKDKKKKSFWNFTSYFSRNCISPARQAIPPSLPNALAMYTRRCYTNYIMSKWAISYLLGTKENIDVEIISIG